MSLKGHVYSSGFKLQYIVEGNGVPTIVVGSSLYYSRTFSNNLRNSLKLVFVDHRGFSPQNDCKDTSQYQLDLLVLRRSEERFSRNAETDIVCRLMLEKN